MNGPSAAEQNALVWLAEECPVDLAPVLAGLAYHLAQTPGAERAAEAAALMAWIQTRHEAALRDRADHARARAWRRHALLTFGDLPAFGRDALNTVAQRLLGAPLAPLIEAAAGRLPDWGGFPALVAPLKGGGFAPAGDMERYARRKGVAARQPIWAWVISGETALTVDGAGVLLRNGGDGLTGPDGATPAVRTSLDHCLRLTSDIAAWAAGHGAWLLSDRTPRLHAPPRLVHVAAEAERSAISLALDAGATAIETPSDPFDDWASLPGRLSMAAEAMGARLEIRAPRAQPAQGAAA